MHKHEHECKVHSALSKTVGSVIIVSKMSLKGLEPLTSRALKFEYNVRKEMLINGLDEKREVSAGIR